MCITLNIDNLDIKKHLLWIQRHISAKTVINKPKQYFVILLKIWLYVITSLNYLV